MIREYKVGPRNSTVCGRPGRLYDWAKFCWNGSEIYTENIKAPFPWIDSFLIGDDCQYLHVPYNFGEAGTIYRVRPNEAMRAGHYYRGRLVKRQMVVLKADGWYWVLLEGDRL